MSKKAKSKRSKQPAERREPSERDREIYSQYKAGCKLQKELAVEYEMDKSRVSQIVKNVELWFADASPRDGELDHGQRLRLERRLERERLELLYGASVRMMQEFEKPAEATRIGAKGTETTRREERNSRLQALKCAIRTTESLGKLAERGPAPLPPEAKTHLRADVLYGHLTHEREQAEAKGRVAASSGCAWDVVYYVLGALHGDLLDPVDPASSLAAALAQIVGRLAGLGAGAGERGQKTEDRGQGIGTEYSVLSTQYLAEASDGAGAQLAQPGGGVEPREMTPDAAAAPAASDWQNDGYGDGLAAESVTDSNRFAGEKTAEFSAGAMLAGGLARRGRESIATTVLPSVGPSPQSTPDPLPAAAPVQTAPARPAPPPEVGSPEWTIAREKWLKERDLRVAAEHDWRIRERLAREADLRQRRAAAAERWRWIEAGRVGG